MANQEKCDRKGCKHSRDRHTGLGMSCRASGCECYAFTKSAQCGCGHLFKSHYYDGTCGYLGCKCKEYTEKPKRTRAKKVPEPVPESA